MESTKRAKVIGITGQAGSGKDTVFSMFEALLPELDVVRVAFGDEVKKEYAEHYGLDLEVLYDEGKKTHRIGLQEWGTEHRRAANKNYWIDKIKTQVDFLVKTADLVVITDVRFINEAEFLKNEYDASIVRVLGSRCRTLRSLHESEVELFSVEVDWTLPNKSTLTDLAVASQFILQELGLEPSPIT